MYKRTVGSESQIDGSKPGIVARQEIGLLLGPRRGSAKLQQVAMDATGDDVANEQTLAIFGRPVAVGVVGHAGQARRSMMMAHQLGGKSQPIVRLAKAGIVRTAQQQRQRLAVTVRRNQITGLGPGTAKRIDLSPGKLFDTRAIQSHAIGVAAVQT